MPSEDINISEFNQYQISDKAPFIINADLECLMEKIEDIKITLKIHSQQKQINMFHQDFQCLEYCNFTEQKIRMTYIEVRIAWKSSVNS